MFNKDILEKFCSVTLTMGVNLQKGQGLEVICPVEQREVAVALTKKAYELGAGIVRIRWTDDQIEKLNYLNATTQTLCDIPKWYVQSKQDLLDKGFCYVAISAEDPECFKEVPSDKLSAVNVAKSKALRKFFNAVTSNGIRWCVTSVPTSAWAKRIFPNEKNSEELLTQALVKTMRLDCANPVDAWKSHVYNLERRAEFLNAQNFEYLHFTNKLGTDLKVGLCDNHVWLSAKEKAQDGVSFIANLPTEEVFTAPHRLKVDGVVYSSRPLSCNGQTVDNFSITFKKGKVVDFSAEKGYETLKNLIETDSGTRRLGEVALIGKNSPISKSGILFFNTLFDENASCHLAFGKAYPTTVKNGDSLSIAQLSKLGANHSIEHEDFMIGTDDMSVVGIKHNGEQITLFKDGEWVI